MTTGNNLTTINFHGASLLAVAGDTPMDTLVAMKPVVEGMGLDWSSQLKRIKRNAVLGRVASVMTIQMPGDDQDRDHVFLPITRLNYWLATLHPSRIPDLGVRSKVIEYQIECADVLFSHFFGKAVRKHPQAPAQIGGPVWEAITHSHFTKEVYDRIMPILTHDWTRLHPNQIATITRHSYRWSVERIDRLVEFGHLERRIIPGTTSHEYRIPFGYTPRIGKES